MSILHKPFSVVATAALFALTACGGGGGGDSDSGPEVPTPVEVVGAAGTLVTSARTPTYASGSVALDAFTALNKARGAAGAGLLVQDSRIDVAAAAHAKYLETNMAAGVTHDEVPTSPNFYAAKVGDRIAKAGFDAKYSTEVIGGTGASLNGADCSLGLLNTVYHGALLLGQTTTVGIGVAPDAGGTPMCIINLASTPADSAAHKQVAPSGALVSYPADGQTNVLDTFYVSFEVPRPPVTALPNPTAGTPILVNVRNADYVNAGAAGSLNPTITKFEVKDGTGNLIPAAVLANVSLRGSGVTLTADPQLDEGFASLVPLYPLTKGTTYTVTFAATLKSDGVPLTKTWSFTTNP